MNAKISCFSTKIDLSLQEKLKKDLLDQGFEILKPPYTLFSAKKKGISCTLYESGKLTVQGKEMQSFIEFYLEPEILKNFSFSHRDALIDKTARIGMDEAGKGDFFGPLCVAAIFADEQGIDQLIQLKVKDSKTLNDETILEIAKKIRAQFSYSTVLLFPKTYNNLYSKFHNLNRLLAWAHTTALSEQMERTKCPKAILDQFAYPEVMEKMLEQKKVKVDLTQRTKGEEDIVVAAASILARAAFVEGMEKLSQTWNFTLPKGAGAKVIDAARRFAHQFGKEKLEEVAKTHFKTMESL